MHLQLRESIAAQDAREKIDASRGGDILVTVSIWVFKS
jgi:hypothetical protein